MGFNVHHLTLGPALVLFVLAIYLSFLTTQIDVDDSVLRSQIWYYSFIAFLIGITLTVCWFIYWGLLKQITRSR